MFRKTTQWQAETMNENAYSTYWLKLMILYNKRKQEKNLLFKSSEPQKKNIQKKKNYYYIIIDWKQAEKKWRREKVNEI